MPQPEIQKQIEKLQEQVDDLEKKIYRHKCHLCEKPAPIRIKTIDGYKLRLCREHAKTFLSCVVLGRFGKKLRTIEPQLG